jgi:hypothetical protein
MEGLGINAAIPMALADPLSVKLGLRP